MALLAGPKRKQKLGTDPNNINWLKDSSAVGQSLLKKMGWKEGAGLGAKEDGRTVPVKASMKIDSRGLGCTPKAADSWIAHQEEFDQLLALLNQPTADGNDAGQPAIVDAPKEKKAEEGQKRFYGRFSRGGVKQLRTTEDLDSIFGRRKSSKKDKEVKADETAVASPSDEVDREDKSHGIPTVTSASSVQDYFAQKMKEKKLNAPAFMSKTNDSDENIATVGLGHDKQEKETQREPFDTSSCTVQDYFQQKMAAKNARKQAEQDQESSNKMAIPDTAQEGEHANMEVDLDEECEGKENLNCQARVCKTEDRKQGNKKKKKSRLDAETEKGKEGTPAEDICDVVDENKGKTKGKRKRGSELLEDQDTVVENENVITEKDAKKSKKKKRKIENEGVENVNTIEKSVHESDMVNAVPAENGETKSEKKEAKKNKNKNSVPKDVTDGDEMEDGRNDNENEDDGQQNVIDKTEKSSGSCKKVKNAKKKQKYKLKKMVLQDIAKVREFIDSGVKWPEQMQAVCSKAGLDSKMVTYEVRGLVRAKLLQKPNSKKKIGKIKQTALQKVSDINDKAIEEINHIEKSVTKMVKQQSKKCISDIIKMAEKYENESNLEIQWGDEIATLKSIKQKNISEIKKTKDEIVSNLKKKSDEVREVIENCDESINKNSLVENSSTSMFPGAIDVEGYNPTASTK